MSSIKPYLSPNLLHILQHSLGCDKHGRGTMFRNHFVTEETSDDGQMCILLVSIGLMVNHGTRGDITGNMSLFTVTERGKIVMRELSPPAPKLSAGEKRYRQFLKSECGESFGDWLRRRSREWTEHFGE